MSVRKPVPGNGLSLSKAALAALFASFALLIGCPQVEAGSAVDSGDIMELSLEELMDIEVTSVSKREEKLSEAAAAIHVLTADDIRRSGCRYIPDLLRMVPGLHVARVDGGRWVVTARGFSGNFANKLLVLIDGRSVYAPLFSGVHWDANDLPLESIERVEVIRGPGAALWGANAVNGVINIITKKASRTDEGVSVRTGIGSDDRGHVSLHYGGAIGQDARYRLYGKHFNRAHSVDSTGTQARDDWSLSRLGLRADWQQSDKTTVTIEGDIYTGDAGVTYVFPMLESPYTYASPANSSIRGGNILASTSHHFSPRSQFAFQLYLESHNRRDVFHVGRNSILDFDMHHHIRTSEWMDLTWGVGYRLMDDKLDSTANAWTIPDTRTDHLFSSFVQSTFALHPKTLRLTLGTKLEHNDYTGFEYQPNARIAWLPNDRQTLWAAVSRAVRTPCRVEHDVEILSQVIPPLSASNPSALPILVSMRGSRRYGSEKLLAYEAGYRCELDKKTSLDLALFLNEYKDLRTLTQGFPYPNSATPTHMVLLLRPGNGMRGQTYGAELALDWRVRHWLELRAAYSYLRMDLETVGGGTALTVGGVEGDSPEHQFSVRSALEIRENIEFDGFLRFVDALPHLNVDRYTAFDVRLGWSPVADVIIEIIGRNLIEERHTEFKSELNNVYTQAERTVHGAVSFGL
jgi:iron complex outermembrane receptor protein